MTNQEVLRLEELREVLTPFFGVIHFKGSKAQRKNAEKELKRLEAKRLLEIEEEKALHRKMIEEMKEEISSIKNHLHDLPKFWWETYELNHWQNQLDRISYLEKEIAELSKHI